jgi:hypothetical protein
MLVLVEHHFDLFIFWHKLKLKRNYKLQRNVARDHFRKGIIIFLEHKNLTHGYYCTSTLYPGPVFNAEAGPRTRVGENAMHAAIQPSIASFLVRKETVPMLFLSNLLLKHENLEISC